jgi:hypothetical protein
MKTHFHPVTGLLPLLASPVSLAQSGGMMDGAWGRHWMSGGYGAPWLTVLVIAALAGFIAWLWLRHKDK